MNIRLDIEYDGTDFSGWQSQGERPTIQREIETIVEKTLGYRSPLLGASRTDAGVHARGQVANFRLKKPSTIPPTAWRDILNARLPRSIRIQRAQKVETDFNAIKNARYKRYLYRIRTTTPSALDRHALFFPRPLQWDRIQKALPHFIGEQDFRAFQGAKSSSVTSIRTLYRFEIEREPEPGVYCFVVEGNGFLKHMVRTMVGTLLAIGEGKMAPEAIPAILKSRDRRLAGPTAPPQGLCLERVVYDS